MNAVSPLRNLELRAVVAIFVLTSTNAMRYINFVALLLSVSGKSVIEEYCLRIV